MTKVGKNKKHAHTATTLGTKRRYRPSSTFSPKAEAEKSEKRRLRRNMTERNRQNQLSAYFSLLRQMMAQFGVSSNPETKVQILDTTIDFIRKLIEDNIKLSTTFKQMSYNLETAASSSKSSLAASSSESSLHRLPVKYNLALLLEQLDLNYSKQQVLEGTNKMLANTRWERLNVLTKRAHLNQ